jgi:hypothetical protein
MTQPSITYNITPHLYTKLAVQAFLGNREAKSAFAGLINTSEVTFKLGYEW